MESLIECRPIKNLIIRALAQEPERRGIYAVADAAHGTVGQAGVHGARVGRAELAQPAAAEEVRVPGICYVLSRGQPASAGCLGSAKRIAIAGGADARLIIVAVRGSRVSG